MSPRTRPPERERAILQAAFDVFHEKGFDGTTMLDIATRAQVGKGTLYGLAPSKEELFLRVVFDVMDHVVQDWVSGLDHVEDPRESLRAAIVRMMDAYEEMTPVTWMAMELLARASRDERLRGRVMASFRELYAKSLGPVRDLIARAQARGQMIRSDAEALARLVAAMLDGLGFQMMFEEGRLPRPALADAFMRMIGAGQSPRSVSEGTPTGGQP